MGACDMNHANRDMPNRLIAAAGDLQAKGLIGLHARLSERSLYEVIA